MELKLSKGVSVISALMLDTNKDRLRMLADTAVIEVIKDPIEAFIWSVSNHDALLLDNIVNEFCHDALLVYTTVCVLVYAAVSASSAETLRVKNSVIS